MRQVHGKHFSGTLPGQEYDRRRLRARGAGLSFPPNGYGLYDMAGNVWEWTSDWYRHDYYEALATQGSVARNPQGPTDSVDPSQPGVKKKVHKGGSFLCTDQDCARSIAGGRGKGEQVVTD